MGMGMGVMVVMTTMKRRSERVVLGILTRSRSTGILTSGLLLYVIVNLIASVQHDMHIYIRPVKEVPRPELSEGHD